MDINKLKSEKTKFNLNSVKKIISDLDTNIRKSVGPMHVAVSDDNKEYAETTEFLDILNAIERANKEKWIMEDNCRNTIYDGCGNIAVVSRDNPVVSCYLILKALKTNNNIVLFVEDTIHVVTKKLIEIVRAICKEQKYNIYIDYFEYNDFSQVYDYNNTFETYIFINELEKYYKFSEIVKDKNVIYSSYGTMTLYLDDKNLKDELLRMDEYIYNNNIELDLLKDMTVEEAVNRINSNMDNYCAVIFTKDTKKAYYFIENVRAKQVFINKNPCKEYLFSIDDQQLVWKKEIHM